jgi:Uri superfamily endonuclease
MKKHLHIDYLRQHDLTVEEVKACAVFEHLTEEQAKEVIATLKTFTKIMYDYFKKENKSH